MSQRLDTLLAAFLVTNPTLPPATPTPMHKPHPKLAISDSVYAFTGPSQSLLDNWSPCTLALANKFTYHTSEHVIFAIAKAGYFHDHATLHEALASPPDTDPKTSKAIGRRVARFNAHNWATASLWISDLVLLLKCLQNPDVAAEVLATGDRKICEASRTDKIWGVGMDARDADVARPAKWRGRNELGKSWMRVREYLKRGVAEGRFEGGIVEPGQVELFFSWFDVEELQQQECLNN